MAEFRWSLGWFATALTIAAGFPRVLNAQGKPIRAEVLGRLRAATVFVGVRDPRSGQLRASGSGFLISSAGEVLTAGHLASVPGELQVIFSSGTPDERRVHAEVLRLDRQGDMALLRTRQKSSAFLRIGDSERLRETDPVVTAGFPLGVQLETGDLGPATSFRGGAVTSLRRSRFGGVMRIEISNGAEVGSSGSPVVDDSGAVIGMVVEVGGQATVLALPSRRLVSFTSEKLQLAERDRRLLLQWQSDPLAQAQAHYECGRFFQARATLQPLLQRNPNSRQVLELHAGIAERFGELEPALATYQRLLKAYPKDPRLSFWAGRAHRLASYRGDGDPRNNFLLCSHFREEASVIDAGTGRVLETLRGVRFSTFATYRADGHYAYTRSGTGVVALDLIVPQEATHLRREQPELGSPDWVSANQDGSLLVAAYSPGDVPNPTSSVVVYRGPDLRECSRFRFDEFFPKGYVTPDGKAAYVTKLLLTSDQGPKMQLQHLDLTNGRLTSLVAAMPVVTWMAYPNDLEVAYALQEDRRVVRINLATGKVLPVAASDINDIAPASEPRQLLLGGKELLVWDAAEDRPVQRYPLPFEAYQVGATLNGEYLFAADGYRERVALIQRATGRISELRLVQAIAEGEPPLPQSSTEQKQWPLLAAFVSPGIPQAHDGR